MVREDDGERLLDCRTLWMELYPRFTLFMIGSMANLDILLRAYRGVERDGATKILSLPSWMPPFKPLEQLPSSMICFFTECDPPFLGYQDPPGTHLPPGSIKLQMHALVRPEVLTPDRF